MDSTTRRRFIQHAATLTGGLVTGTTTSASESANPTQTVRLSKTASLRALLKQPGIHVVPEAHSVFAARLAEMHGFKAIYIGGNMMSAMYLGIEDYALVTISELVEIGGRIANGVHIPAIVDADQGGETSLNVYRNVTAYEQAGIAAMHIEDTRNPKHMGRGMSELMPIDEMVQRISAAVEARSDPDFTIICRSDCLGLGTEPGSTAEAVRRGTAFANAGGDAFFCVGMKSEQVDEIAREVPIPLIGLNIPTTDVRGTRLKVNIHAVQVYQPAMQLYEKMLLELQENGQFLRREERRLSPTTMSKILQRKEYRSLAKKWLSLKD